MSDPKETPRFQVTDRRFWVEDEAAIERATPPEKQYPSYVEELRTRTELAEKRLKERLAELEEENAAFRQRLNAQVEQRVEQQKAQLLQSFLEIVDNLERALEAAGTQPDLETLKKGVELNLELFRSKLRQAGVEPLEHLGEPFDPREAEAMTVVDVEDPGQDHRVIQVLERGYRLGETILRPAKVTVGRYQSPEEGSESKGGESS